MTGDRFRHEALGVVFQVREDRLCVLLWQRAAAPFAGAWALPGGSLLPGERLGTSASRHLAEKVDIAEIAHLEQLETRSDPHRDPRERVLATAYLALVTVGAQPRLPADTAWHPVDFLPTCAFDHESIIGSARERLRAKLSYTNIGFALAPAVFTIAQLRDVFAAALGYQVSATNLQRILTRRAVIEPTSALSRPTSTGGRPAVLYQYATRTLVVTNPFAAFRPRELAPWSPPHTIRVNFASSAGSVVAAGLTCGPARRHAADRPHPGRRPRAPRLPCLSRLPQTSSAPGVTAVHYAYVRGLSRPDQAPAGTVPYAE